MAHAQTVPEPYSRGNTFAFFAGAGFPDSGVYTEAPGRTLLGFGARYEHRFWNSKSVEFHYLAEFRPVVLVRNVTTTFTERTSRQRAFRRSASPACKPPAHRAVQRKCRRTRQARHMSFRKW